MFLCRVFHGVVGSNNIGFKGFNVNVIVYLGMVGVVWCLVL